MPFGLPFATTTDWPALKYGIMSTCLRRSALMFCADTMMSHLFPSSAGMITVKTVLTKWACRPSRLAISLATSGSDPMIVPSGAKASCGGYGTSMQTKRLPARTSWSVGTVATGVGATEAATDAEAAADVATEAAAEGDGLLLL